MEFPKRILVLCLCLVTGVASAAERPGLWRRVRSVFTPGPREEQPRPVEPPLENFVPEDAPPASEPGAPNEMYHMIMSARWPPPEEAEKEVERRLLAVAGVYIEFEPSLHRGGRRAVSLQVLSNSDGVKFFVIDRWQAGDVVRLFEYPIDEIRPRAQRRQVPFTIYLTLLGENQVRAVYGHMPAPLGVFLLKYQSIYENDAINGRPFESLSINLKENGEPIFQAPGMRFYKSTTWDEWRHLSEPYTGVSLANFVAGRYPLPEIHPDCEKYLVKTGNSSAPPGGE